MIAKKKSIDKPTITKIGITDDKLTGRAGLFFLSRYVQSTAISQVLASKFFFLRKRTKGKPLVSIFNQIRCHFLNGEDFHLVQFDQLKKDSPGRIILRLDTMVMDNAISRNLLKYHKANYIGPEAIVLAYHNRALDELTNRSFKDFGTEHMPFKRFATNSAFYYLMVISVFLFETFKYDMHSEVIPITWYPETFRRKYVDTAGKIVESGRRITLKLTADFHSYFNAAELWQKILTPNIPSVVALI